MIKHLIYKKNVFLKNILINNFFHTYSFQRIDGNVKKISEYSQLGIYLLEKKSLFV